MTGTPTASTGRFPSWAGDLLGIAVVITMSIVPGHGKGPPPPGHHPMMQLLPVIVVVLAITLIPLRRRWPIPTLVASTLLYCATITLDRPSSGVGFVVVLAAYSVGSHLSRRTTLIAGGFVTGLLALLSVTVSNFGVIDPSIFQIAAGVAVAAALGDSARSYREFVIAATDRAERAEKTRDAEVQRQVAEERLRIAQDLHDTVAHQISVISLNAGVASSALESSPQKAREALSTIRVSARGVLSEISEVLQYLRTDSGTAASAVPQPGLRDIDALIERLIDTGLNVEVTRSGDPGRVPESSRSATAEIVAYRVVQEGLTNALKHGSDRRATVDLAVSEESLTLTITNPVSSETPNQAIPPSTGLGLTGIRERIAAVHGTVTIVPTADTFTLTAVIPLRDEANA